MRDEEATCAVRSCQKCTLLSRPHVSQNTPDNQMRNAEDRVSGAGGGKREEKKLKLRLKITAR
jgi:hypothetical protein